MKHPNAYSPEECEVIDVTKVTSDVSSFKLKPKDKLSKLFDYKPGQFMELSILGIGECPISITSSPIEKEHIEFAIKKLGSVTSRIHEREVGDLIWMRGPYGNSFLDKGLKGNDILFIAGGIGLAPLRSLIKYICERKKDFGKTTLLYGARNPAELCFKDEFDVWRELGIDVHITVDKGQDAWKGNVGVVPQLLDKIRPNLKKTKAIICGPPIMIRFTALALRNKGFADEDIIISLERLMKCGIGKCGHCNVGSKYVCIDGPVFTIKELEGNPEYKL
ncbi:MAG: FAD/NAD(P)-binding protein [Candidatus Altiarchaeota archaeon]